MSRLRRLLLALGPLVAGCVTVQGGQAPFTASGNHIYVQALLNDQGPFTLMLDTGCHGLIVTRELAQQLQLPLQWTEVAVGGIGGQRRALVSHLRLVEVGGARGEYLPVVVAALNAPGNGAVGLLGSGFLHQFRVKLDYRAQRVVFEPP